MQVDDLERGPERGGTHVERAEFLSEPQGRAGSHDTTKYTILFARLRSDRILFESHDFALGGESREIDACGPARVAVRGGFVLGTLRELSTHALRSA